MKLRTALLLGISVLVAAIIASTAFAVSVIVARSARKDLDDELARTHRVFDELLATRHSVLHSDCRVIANEPRLRAMVATADITHETVIGVIGELKQSLGSDLFLLLDNAGVLVGDTADPTASGFDLSGQPAVASAIKSGEGTGVWISKDLPYQVQACRVEFGAQAVGIIVVGRIFDDAAAKTIEQQTGSGLVVAIDGKQVAGSMPDAGARPHVTSDVGDTSEEVVLDGTRYVVTGGAFPRYQGKRVVTYALLRSLDEALAPSRNLTRGVLGIALVAIIAALLLAVALARRLSKPVDELVAFTKRVAAGKLDQPAKPSGTTETRSLATAMNVMVAELEQSRKDAAVRERLEKELEIAVKIQTSILPRSFDVNDLDIAAQMVPASEVGGDYYDILPVKNGCWIGIGDVAGHGLTAGLEMLMVQSVVAALVRADPDAAPKDHLRVLNGVIFENIRNRLEQDEHITLTLMHYTQGVVTFTGAHEEIIVCRTGAEHCERIETPGTWLGAIRDISRFSQDTKLELAIGDLMVLYSDGVTEARNAAGEQFGMDRLCSTIEGARGETVEVIRDVVTHAVKEWQGNVQQEDDVSLVVVRRLAAT